MKKNVMISAITAALVLSLAGCGAKELNVDKYVTLPQYKGIEVTVDKQEVMQEEIDSTIQEILDANPAKEEITNRTEVKEGDVVNIDYVGKIDGEDFSNNSSPEGGYDLAIGSNSFIEGFEEGLIGANLGSTVELNLTFPEQYNEEVAGKDVVFTVTINKLQKEVPAEFTDEFVAGLGYEEYTTTEELTNMIRENLASQYESQYETEKQNVVWNTVFAAAEIKDPPEDMVARYEESLWENVDSYASQNGITRADLITELGYTEEDYNENVKNNAVSIAKENLLIQAIAKAEGMEVTDEEVTAFGEENYARMGYETVEAYVEAMGAEDIKEYLLSQKVTAFILDNAVITENIVQGTSDVAAEAETAEEAEGETEAVEEQTEAPGESAAETEAAE